jgi:hypothetical protein
MSKHSTATRRMFLKCGALLAGPIAAASVPAIALAKGQGDDGVEARLRRLEDDAAIQELHQSWLRQVNAGGGGLTLSGGTVTRVTTGHAGTSDRIEIAADGRSAIGRFDCAVDLETLLPDDSTLGQMAHAQGTGMLRTTDRRMLTVEYRKVAGAWKIEAVASHAI